jgi:hypothetical protein
MTRIWRHDARVLLIAFLVLDIALVVYTQTAGAAVNGHNAGLASQQAGWTLLDAFLVGRVWRGGRIAWAVLLVLNLILLAMLLLLAPAWTAYDAPLIVFLAAQLLVLVAPAVRHHLGRAQRS